MQSPSLQSRVGEISYLQGKGFQLWTSLWLHLHETSLALSFLPLPSSASTLLFPLSLQCYPHLACHPGALLPPCCLLVVFLLTLPPPLLKEGQETLNCGIDYQERDGAVKILIWALRNNAMRKVWGKHSVLPGISDARMLFLTLNSFITRLSQLQIQLGRVFSLKCTNRRRQSHKKNAIAVDNSFSVYFYIVFSFRDSK